MPDNIFFFFKQKTAYEITRRDWSSDVCSSDLQRRRSARRVREGVGTVRDVRHSGRRRRRSEERRVGKSVPCCVDLGGGRIIKKKKKAESVVTCGYCSQSSSQLT